MIRLGIGTGRCGTHSLSNMVESAGVTCPHESFVYGDIARESGRMFFPHWDGRDTNFVADVIGAMHERDGDYSEIALYHLPHVETLIERFDTRVVAMERERDKVVESYMKWTGGRDHWSFEPDRSLYREDPWDRCYMKFDGDTKRENVGLYWDYYREETTRLCQRYPDRVIKVRTEDMSNYDTYVRIMEHYQLPVVGEAEFTPFHTNKGK